MEQIKKTAAMATCPVVSTIHVICPSYSNIRGRSSHNADPHSMNTASFGIIQDAIARVEIICLEGRVEKIMMNQ